MEIITEKDFQNKMDAEVAPILKKYRYSGYFSPDGKGNLYYERYMQGQAEKVIVMVHGFTESAEKYTEMIYYFFQDGYQVYIVDIRGHGRSVRENNDLSLVHIDNYERYITDLEYFVERIIKKEAPNIPIYLYGHSMGGGISAAFLEKNPDVFKKAILSSPMIRPATGSVPFSIACMIATIQVRRGKGKKYVVGQHEFCADETFENSASTSRERYEYYYRKKLKEKLFQTNGASYSWLREAARLSKFVLKKENCRKIHTEVLLFQAQQDDYVDRKAQERFVKQARNIQSVTMAGTKHEIYMSQDETMRTYIEQILAFLR